MNNKEVAELLKKISAAYTIEDEEKNRFRIVAYDRAAIAIEHLTSEIKDLWDDQKLKEIPGIGANIGQHLDELFRTGKVRHFQQVLRPLPEAMFGFLKIPGIGAKTAFKLSLVLKIKKAAGAIKKLKQAAEKGKIREISGFGQESEEKILTAIKEFLNREKKQRILLPFADQEADEIIAYLKAGPKNVKLDSLGSLRRRCATVGDIDISSASPMPKQVLERFIKYPKKKRVLEKGGRTASLILNSGSQVDLMIQPQQAYGALLQHFTGSKHHNIALREYALKLGFSLSEYGIRVKDKKKKNNLLEQWPSHYNNRKDIFEFAEEKDFYRFLGLDYIEPELREAAGEIEAAKKGKLPKLIELKEIKGDLHIHSDFPIEPSHDLGTNSLKEIVEKAKQLGYQYLGIAEHNPSISKHNDRQIINLLARKKGLVDKFNYSSIKKFNIRIFNGLEIDIKPDGSLAIPEKAFNYLDYAIVSVHTSFRMSRKEMTQRILKALAHPKISILGHPTGRKLNLREGYELDWEQIFNFCKRKRKILEINAWPDRLDLPDILVREAVKHGVKLIINTDAHAVEEMSLMEFGVSVARRGWAEKKDILNTLPREELSEWL